MVKKYGRCYNCGKKKPIEQLETRFKRNNTPVITTAYRKCNECYAALDKLRAEHYVPAKMKRSVYEKWGRTCLRCKIGIGHIDHIIPITKGGKTTFDNLQILCRSCNSIKKTDVIDFRQ